MIWKQMMNYLKRRKLKKITKHLIHESKHAQHMREDITDVAIINDLIAKRNALRGALQEKDWGNIEDLAQALAVAIGKVFPEGPSSRLKENLEVIVVALTVALAFRTYFIQPFKIPTGSMQPTLNGITFHKPSTFEPFNHYPLRLINFALFGEYPVTIRAIASGRIAEYGTAPRNIMRTGISKKNKVKTKVLDTNFKATIYGIQNVNLEIPVPIEFETYVKNGQWVNKGDIIASGTITVGDHIFVNKVKYNFLRPERGDIIVFDTSKIDYPGIKTNTFYIKRLVGLPGESVAINQPAEPTDVSARYLVINGTNIIRTPYPFERLLNEKGYAGYILADPRYATTKRPAIMLKSDTLQLTDNQFLPFGDNTEASLDGRFFGGVERQHLVGPAFAVYWPLSKRWGVTK